MNLHPNRVYLPERVWIDFIPASYGSRSLAYLLDFICRWTIVGFIFVVLLFFDTGISLILSLFDGSYRSFLLAIAVLVVFVIEWGYPIFFDVVFHGVSPGKKLVGLRVVDEAGLAVTFHASLIRNIFLIIDLLPLLGVVGLISMVSTKRSQRLGDLAARTMVVFEPEAVEYPQSVALKSEQGIKYVIPFRLYSLIEQFFRRRNLIDSPLRDRYCHQLLELTLKTCHLEQIKYDMSSPSATEETLQAIFMRACPVVGKEALSQSRLRDWGKFHQEMTDIWAQIAPLASFGAYGRTIPAEQVERSLSAYHKLCQLYVYLTSIASGLSFAYRAEAMLQRARYAVYGRRLRRSGAEEGSFVERVRRGFEYSKFCVLLSVITFSSSVIISFLSVIYYPELGWHFLSDQVVADLRAGKLWTDQIKGIEALSSSQIMTNNISVSLLAFALGITGGVGTVWLLVQNGIMLGGIFAALSFYGMAYPLGNFVIAHGLLELSVIVVSGGCGLFIADALINPGTRNRFSSLQIQSRRIIDILILNGIFLMLAGVIEGYLSPNPAIPFEVKALIGVAAALSYWRLLFTA